MRRTALRGHALRSEGKPYRLSDPDDGGLDVRAAGSGGYALCECGTSSGWLTSDGARKAWHRDHKEAMPTDLPPEAVTAAYAEFRNLYPQRMASWDELAGWEQERWQRIIGAAEPAIRAAERERCAALITRHAVRDHHYVHPDPATAFANGMRRAADLIGETP